MSIAARVSEGVTVSGRTFNGTRSVSADAIMQVDVSVPAGVAATLSTRTDDDTGTLTGPTGHGITTGAIVDLYWTGGHQRNVTVGTVSGTSIPFDLGSGDNLPAQGTSVRVCVRSQVELPVDGDSIQLITFSCDVPGVFSLQESTTVHLGKYVSGKAYRWDVQDGTTNPVAGDTLTQIFMSHGDATTRTMRAAVLYNT